MSDRTARLPLFLDIDGPLLPIGGDPRRRPSTPDPEWHFERLKHAAGLALSTLPRELVWTTAREETATMVAKDLRRYRALPGCLLERRHPAPVP